MSAPRRQTPRRNARLIWSISPLSAAVLPSTHWCAPMRSRALCGCIGRCGQCEFQRKSMLGALRQSAIGGVEFGNEPTVSVQLVKVICGFRHRLRGSNICRRPRHIHSAPGWMCRSPPFLPRDDSLAKSDWRLLCAFRRANLQHRERRVSMQFLGGLIALLVLGVIGFATAEVLVRVQTLRSMRMAPKPDDIERAATYGLVLDSSAKEVPSFIFDMPGATEPCWRLRTDPPRSPWSPLNFWRKPEFLLIDRDSREILRIRRRRRIPACFHLVVKGDPIGTVQPRGILRNKYALAFKDGPTWTFHMPLFTWLFWGESNTGERIWVQMGPSKVQWTVRMQPEADDVRLLAGLAFIHREWWCYS